ncbi:MAG: LysM peptidoglycan-binding domain-containing protein [Verrucomicrobiae bacterium]|nr:LysM peptidoglycan-binding domain-containing protein [Verrucomicrobiae bacterium]
MRRLLIFISLGLLLVGCSPEARKESQNNDYESSTFKRAKEKYELRDYRGAISLYEEVLRDNPLMAKAHLELGLIYNDKIGDPVSAIYHFRRYLKLKPNAERAKIIEEWIARAELAIASSQPNSPMESTEQFVQLQKENLLLKQSTEKLQQELNALRYQVVETKKLPISSVDASVATEKTAVSMPVPTTPATNTVVLRLVTNSATASPTIAKTEKSEVSIAVPIASKKHTVLAGETLWRIAVRYYPEQVKEGTQKIMEANGLSDAAKIKSGQVLIIPQ